MAESMNLGASSCSSIASQSTHRHSFSTKTIRVTQEPQRDPFSLDNVDYLNFLRRLGGQNVSFIPKENIERSSDDAYGAGATMIAYPGAWYRDREDSKTPEVVVVKYCNDRIPQGASTMPGFVNAMNSRFKAICQELDVMAGMEGRYYNNFPRLFGVCWEDVLSPAGIHLYRPILVMEAAISDLEMYVRGGGLENAQRHQDEKRFVSSILLAMNFLHQECNLVHGDLKPSNILVFQDKQTEMAELKLADFGFAYEITGYSPGGKDPEKFSQGTPYWAAPEMYPDDMWSFLTSPGLYTRDYYSFGLVVWFILFGYPVGDLKNGLTQEDEKVFKEIKQAGMISFKYDDLNSQEQRETYGTGLRPSIQDMLKQQFESRWKWGISGPCAIDEFKKIEEAEYAEDEDSSEEGDDEIEEILGKMMQKLMSEGKITELEWNSQASKWLETHDPFHHVFRALMETALQRMADDRRTVLHKPAGELITQEISYQLAALYVIDDPDPKSEVFGGWNIKHGPTSLRFFEMRLTRQWNNKKEQHESGRDLFIPRLTAEAVEHLPQGMAEAMLEQLIIEASDESKTIIERKTAVMNTSAFRYRFPDAADFDAWYKEETNSSSKKEKLLYVIRQSLHQKKVSQDEVDAWVLEGITNFPGRGIGEPLLEMFRGIDRSLLSIPVRCAMWDYVTELRINEPEATDYSKNSPSPIFQSIIDGDFQEFKAQASALEQVLPSLVFDECNLLHFAIVCKQIEIMRYLMVEKDFIIGEGEGHIQVLKSLLFDPEAGTMLVEMDLCYALAHKKLFKRSEVYNKRMGPLEIFFEQQALALIAEAGSMTLMDIIDRAYRDPFRMQLVEEGAEECNPLYGALQTRRFLTFGKLLDWGAPYTRTFSPDAVIDGIPLLIHAIRSMAPFFVGALLANGAKVNEMNPTKAGYEASPLYEACFSLTERYKASLQRRQALHEEMGFSARVLKQDELAISSSEIDFKAMQKLILHLLLRNGANINLGARFPPDPITRERAELTPLLICIQKNNEELAIFLIEMGAEINPPDSTLTPLQLAINKNLPGVVDCLLARGASPDGAVPLTLGPPLVNAIAYNRLEMFELLLNKGASLKIEVPLYDGELVLHAILEQTSEAYLRDLSQDQLEATLRTASSPSLEMLIQDKRRQRQILLAHLRNMPRDKLTQLINHPTPAGATIIFFATEYIQGEAEDLELLRLIIENTTDINARIAPGYSAFEKAIALGNTAFTSVFLRQVMGNLRLG